MYNDDQPVGGVHAANDEVLSDELREEAEMDDSRDLIEGVDEDGNNVLLEVVRYFFYNGDEYVVLGDAHEGDCDCDCEHCEHDHSEDDEDEDDAVNLYIMKVIETEENGEEMEQFVPVEDEDLLEKLIEVVQSEFDSDEELDDPDED